MGFLTRKHDSRQYGIKAKLALIALLASTLPACDPGEPGLRGTIYIYLGLTEDQALSEQIVASKRERAEFFLDAFQREHPGVGIQLQYYPEAELADRLRSKNLGGQGPDLLLINAGTVQLLHREALIRSIEPSQELLSQFRTSAIPPLRDGPSSLIGVPFVFEPQLACFNKKLLKRAPSDLKEMLETSDTRPGIGAPLTISGLYWSLGSLGARKAYHQLILGQKLTQDSTEALLHWLQWLQDANTHAGMYFYTFPERLVADFSGGKISWTPCRSPFIGEFEKELADDFGVALLPQGPGGIASPLSDMRVWAFGLDSSENQKKIARKLVEFAANPLVQFRISLDSDEVLPTNRRVVIPIQRSAFLHTLVAAHENSPPLTKEILEYQSDLELQGAANKIMGKLLYGDLKPKKALQKLEKLFRPETKQASGR